MGVEADRQVTSWQEVLANSTLLRQLLWQGVYQNRFAQCGNTLTIVNFADELRAGLVSAATFAGYGFHASGLAPVWTPSVALSALDTPLSLTDLNNFVGDAKVVPFATLNGLDEEMTTPDAAGWSTAGAFSIFGWINLATLISNIILAKWDETAAAEAREFSFEIDSNGDLSARVYDETNNAEVSRKFDTPLDLDTWYFVGMSFDGGADAAGVSIMLDGDLVDDADILDEAGFANAIDTATVVSIGNFEGTGGVGVNFFDGLIAGACFGLAYCQVELTAAQFKNMYEFERPFFQ